MRKRMISSKLRLWFLHGLYFSPIRTHPYQDEVGRQWLCIEITINSSLGFSILLHGFLLLCHMLHRFNIPAFRLVVYHHLSGLSFTMPCSCYILTCSNPGIFAQELQLKAWRPSQICFEVFLCCAMCFMVFFCSSMCLMVLSFRYYQHDANPYCRFSIFQIRFMLPLLWSLCIKWLCKNVICGVLRYFRSFFWE